MAAVVIAGLVVLASVAITVLVRDRRATTETSLPSQRAGAREQSTDRAAPIATPAPGPRTPAPTSLAEADPQPAPASAAEADPQPTPAPPPAARNREAKTGRSRRQPPPLEAQEARSTEPRADDSYDFRD